MSQPALADPPAYLVPLDGSRLAEAVLPAVEALALRAHARVVLLHVLEEHPPATVHGERHLRGKEEAARYLEEVAARLRDQGLTVEAHLHEAREADVAKCIAAHTAERRTALVILSTHGTGGLRDLLFGSIAQQALQHGTLPLLLIRPLADGAAPPFDIHHILVLLEGVPDASSEPALETALALAPLFGAHLHLAMVIPTPATLTDERALSGLLLPATMKAVLDLAAQGATEYLRQARERCQAAGVPATAEVLRGDAVLEVLDLARRLEANLLVAASHGTAGLRGFLEGSAAKRITDKVSAPILLVRAAALSASPASSWGDTPDPGVTH